MPASRRIAGHNKVPAVRHCEASNRPTALNASYMFEAPFRICFEWVGNG